jgi:hypothetical protein
MGVWRGAYRAGEWDRPSIWCGCLLKNRRDVKTRSAAGGSKLRRRSASQILSKGICGALARSVPGALSRFLSRFPRGRRGSLGRRRPSTGCSPHMQYPAAGTHAELCAAPSRPPSGTRAFPDGIRPPLHTNTLFGPISSALQGRAGFGAHSRLFLSFFAQTSDVCTSCVAGAYSAAGASACTNCSASSRSSFCTTMNPNTKALASTETYVN